jgi:hypothetical protein
MAEPTDPLDHLARGIEELMRAGAETLALARRARSDSEGSLGALIARLGAELSHALESSERPWLAELRDSLRSEVGRWDERARDDDDAAARVRDLFAALLDVLSSDGDEEDRAQPARRAPRRKAAR